MTHQTAHHTAAGEGRQRDQERKYQYQAEPDWVVVKHVLSDERTLDVSCNPTGPDVPTDTKEHQDHGEARRQAVDYRSEQDDRAVLAPREPFSAFCILRVDIDFDLGLGHRQDNVEDLLGRIDRWSGRGRANRLASESESGQSRQVVELAGPEQGDEGLFESLRSGNDLIDPVGPDDKNTLVPDKGGVLVLAGTTEQMDAVYDLRPVSNAAR